MQYTNLRLTLTLTRCRCRKQLVSNLTYWRLFSDKFLHFNPMCLSLWVYSKISHDWLFLLPYRRWLSVSFDAVSIIDLYCLLNAFTLFLWYCSTLYIIFLRCLDDVDWMQQFQRFSSVMRRLDSGASIPPGHTTREHNPQCRTPPTSNLVNWVWTYCPPEVLKIAPSPEKKLYSLSIVLSGHRRPCLDSLQRSGVNKQKLEVVVVVFVIVNDNSLSLFEVKRSNVKVGVSLHFSECRSNPLVVAALIILR